MSQPPSIYALALRALGPAPVVQVVPPKDEHLAYIAASEGLPTPETAGAGQVAISGNHPLVDHGGSIIAHVKLFLVYLGQWWSDTAELEAFAAALVEDGYLDVLQPFGVGRGSFLGSVHVPPFNGNVVSDAMIQAQLAALIAAGTVPAPDGSTLYVLCTPDGTEVDMGGSHSCAAVGTGFCGYHGALDNRTFYAVMPASTCPACDGGLGGYASFTEVLSHEVAEACTDAVPGQGWYIDAPGDPYDGWECGDAAAWPQPPLDYGHWKVQGEWVGDHVALGAYQPAQPPPQQQPFSVALPFFQWLCAWESGVLDTLEKADPIPAHVAVIEQWRQWLAANGYDKPPTGAAVAVAAPPAVPQG